MLTKNEAVELHKTTGSFKMDQSQALMKHLKDTGSLEHIELQASGIADAVRSGIKKPVELYAQQLDLTLQLLDKNGFQIEDFKHWPIFRDLLVKRRVANFVK